MRSKSGYSLREFMFTALNNSALSHIALSHCHLHIACREAAHNGITTSSTVSLACSCNSYNSCSCRCYYSLRYNKTSSYWRNRWFGLREYFPTLRIVCKHFPIIISTPVTISAIIIIHRTVQGWRHGYGHYGRGHCTFMRNYNGFRPTHFVLWCVLFAQTSVNLYSTVKRSCFASGF